MLCRSAIFWFRASTAFWCLRLFANACLDWSKFWFRRSRLTSLPGIFVDPDHGEVEYFHLLFDHHEVIFAEGAPTESFYTGPEALKAISAEAMEEILAILPELNLLSYAPDPACHIPTGDLQKKLVARHAKNNQPLI